MGRTRGPNGSGPRNALALTLGAGNVLSGLVKAEFVAATVAEQAYTGGAVEICAVLNRLSPGLLSGPDDRVIDEVDALMDELYRDNELFCPGHRWLSGPRPVSIRGHLVNLHTGGKVGRDAVTGEWRWFEVTSYFYLPAGRVESRVADADNRLFRYRRMQALS
jgi:hypothetical protein